MEREKEVKVEVSKKEHTSGLPSDGGEFFKPTKTEDWDFSKVTQVKEMVMTDEKYLNQSLDDWL